MPRMQSPTREVAPCLGCADKEPGCHGKCDAYKAWRGRLDLVNEARVKYRDRPMSRDERRERKIGK